MIWGDRLLAGLDKNHGPEAVQRKQQLVAPWFWISIGGACLAMCVIEMRAGVVKGVRLGTIPRAEHPVWFWGITMGIGLASLVMITMNFVDFTQALKTSRQGTNGADDRT